jgi:ArsR family transcriptional regulator
MPPAQLAAPARTRGCCSPVAVALEAGMADQLAALFRALADPTRVQILHMLKAASEPVCVCDLTAVFELSQPTVSHHLGKLRKAGLITSFKKGIWTFHSLAEPLPAAAGAALALVP